MEPLIFMFGCWVGRYGGSHEAHYPWNPNRRIDRSVACSLAQGYSGTSSNPATSVSKDETTSMTKQSKKRMSSHKKKSSKPQTTGSGSSKY
jgi:hypothetical protein